MGLRGIDLGPARLPHLPLEEEQLRALRHDLQTAEESLLLS
ncbi:MAG: hypothetical protein WD314_00105 [Trueperaceae bacterium]